jgi:NADP-dependent 3-hydroxy acid dehydrogenase YdfG
MDIKGAGALIAGGGGGFGAATAHRLHAAGARVAVCDLDEAKGKAVADDLGDGALFVRTDVTDEDSVQQASTRPHSSARSGSPSSPTAGAAGRGRWTRRATPPPSSHLPR